MTDFREIHRKTCKRWNIRWSAHYLTFSCLGRRPLFQGERSVKWFLQALARARTVCRFHLWAYVVMPEHVHLVLWPPEDVTISQILYQIKKPVTTWAISWYKRNDPAGLSQLLDQTPGGKASHRFWLPGGGYDRNLRSLADIHEKIKYTHLNPARRGLVSTPDQWPWSSYRAWAEGTDDPVPIDRESLPPLFVK